MLSGGVIERFGEHAILWGSLRCQCDCLIVVRRAEAGIAMTEGVRESIVQHRCSHVEEGLHRRPVPAHLLSCPFSRVPDAKFHPVISVPVDFFDAGMRGGGRALSDG
jgi:hypothetical protein